MAVGYLTVYYEVGKIRQDTVYYGLMMMRVQVRVFLSLFRFLCCCCHCCCYCCCRVDNKTKVRRLREIKEMTMRKLFPFLHKP